MIADERVIRFHPGQVWMTSRGAYHRVRDVEVNGNAILKAGAYGDGRLTRRPWDHIGDWVLVGDPTAPEDYPVGQEGWGIPSDLDETSES